MENKEILFFKYCSGVANPEESAMVRELLACSEVNRKELSAVEEVISLEKQMEELSRHDTEKGYSRMIAKARRYEMRRRVQKIILNACAILVLPLIVSVFMLAYSNMALKDQFDYTCWREIRATPGTVASVELPDHSKVWVNAGSTLSYPVNFKNKDRIVKIEGEAYFDVQTDREHPFRVITESGLEVVAHGTKFNVSAYRDDRVVETVLEEGAVSLMLDGEAKCLLEPGESGVYSSSDNVLRISDVNVPEKTAWTQGKIIFRNASLEDVFVRLGRKYNVDFIFHDPDHLSDLYRCRITFQDETIQQVMGYLQTAAPIRYKIYPPVRQEGDILNKQEIEVWLTK